MNRRFPHLVLAAAAISLSLTGCSDDSSSSDTTAKASSGGDCATGGDEHVPRPHLVSTTVRTKRPHADTATAFDDEHARLQGLPVGRLSFLLLLVVAPGIQGITLQVQALVISGNTGVSNAFTHTFS